MFTYTDINNFPTSVQFIDDTDAPNATNFNTGPEGLANRTYWLRKRGVTFKSLVITNGMNWTAPASGTFGVAFIEGNGGGGGGGAGGTANTTAGYASGGGGGGGSAIRSIKAFLPIAGHVYSGTIGAVGIGGGGGGGGFAGNDGGDSIWQDTTAAVEVMRFRGGQGGAPGSRADYTGAQSLILARGGGPVRSGVALTYIAIPETTFIQTVAQPDVPGHGGVGGFHFTPGHAGISSVCNAGGAGAATGADSSGFFGGGGGGGAGASGVPGTSSPAGGPGGVADASGGGATAGSSGGYGGINTGTGVGGGGGGGGGSGLTFAGIGGDGGWGDNGSMTLYWSEIGTI